MGMSGAVAAGPAQTQARAAAPSALTRSRPVAVREAARAAGAGPRWNFADLAIRPKLNVGAVDDPQERDADRAADRVMRMADPAVPVAGTAPPKLRRQSSASDEEHWAERAPAEVAASASLADAPTREQAAVADAAPPMLRRQSSASEEEDKPALAPAEGLASAGLAGAPVRAHAVVAHAAPPTLRRKCSTCGAEDKLRRAPADVAAGAGLMGVPTREQAAVADAAPLTLRRQCSACDAEDKLQRAAAQGAVSAGPAPGAASVGLPGDVAQGGPAGDVVQDGPPDDAASAGTAGGVAQGGPMEAPASVHAALAGSGVAMDAGLRAFFEPRFGQDFGHVRLHTDTVAAQSAQAVGAKAYTVGSDIVLGQGQYDAASEAGRHLLAHELAHVTQNDAGTARPVLRRLTHDFTPTNCQNYTIPLPAWLAGIAAHAQIASTLKIPPHSIPRGTKASGALVGVPSPPAITPIGFADLWTHAPPGIGIAEIKSSSIGSTIAAREAAHYALRHTEWLGRVTGGTADARDKTYLGDVGGPIPGGPLNLAPTTGSDLVIGNFVPDPSKLLHIEADTTGAVIYWCTGTGMVGSPVWLPVLKKALDALAKKLQQAKKALQEAAARAAEAAKAIARVVVKVLIALLVILLVLAIVALVVVSIICLLGAAETFGLTLACSALGLAGAAAALDEILLLVGLPALNLGAALVGAFNASNPATAAADSSTPEANATYDTEDDTTAPASGAAASASAAPGAGGAAGGSPGAAGAAPASTPGDVLTAALNPLVDKMSDPLGFIASIKDSLSGLDSGAVVKLQNAAAALDNLGDSTTAGFLRDTITGTGMDKPGALAANDDQAAPDASAVASAVPGAGAAAGAAPATPVPDNQAAPATAAS